MKLYLNELAPWERKNEYYHHIQLGKDVRAQTETINNQTKAMITAQLASTNAIIASQERISEGIDNISYGIDRVEQGIYGLQATFEWGISEVVWQIEQNREVLRDILQVLSAPLDTQAKELRKRAEEAYANGWIDDALQDFLESEEKNRYDFSIHISLGIIYLLHKIDKEKALEYFEQAIKYAKPKSAYHTSYALLHKALIMRDIGKLEEAEKCTSEAIKMSTNFSEALYQNAQYNALLNKHQRAISMLEQAIENDVNYCEKCHNEKDFDNIREYIIALFEKLRKREETKAKSCFPQIKQKFSELCGVADVARKEFSLKFNDNEIRVNLKRVEELIKRHSFRDYLEANRLIQDVTGKFQKLYKETQNEFDNQISSLRSKISSIKSSHDRKFSEYFDKLPIIWGIGIPLGIILGLRGCWVEGPGKMGSIGAALGALFGIPFKIALLAGFIHLLIYVVLKISEKVQPGEINGIETQINKIKQISNDLKSI